MCVTVFQRSGGDSSSGGSSRSKHIVLFECACVGFGFNFLLLQLCEIVISERHATLTTY